MKKKLKSKKFVVYFYQGKSGGGSIHYTSVRGKMTKTREAPFYNKKEAKEMLIDLVDDYCKEPR